MKSDTIIRGTGKIIVNGKTVCLNEGSIKINEHGIFVDGVNIEQHTEPSQAIKVEITGDVQSVETKISDITVHGNVGMAKTMSGDIRCDNVESYAQTMSGNIICTTAKGHCSTMSGDIICR